MEYFTCITCSKVKIKGTSSLGVYCSNKCQQRQRKIDYIKRWLAGIESGTTKHSTSEIIREYLFIEQKGKCAHCKRKTWMGKPIPLEMEHKDGNWRNGSRHNLELICPNCHALTPTFKGRNKGKGLGRRWRDQYKRRWEK